MGGTGSSNRTPKIEKCQYIKNDQYGEELGLGAGSDIKTNIKCVRKLSVPLFRSGITVSRLVARSSFFSLNLLVFRLYGGVFFRRMSETDDESQHFGHLAGARQALTKPRFLTFWCDKRIFAHSALCLGTPPVVNNSGNSVAAGEVRLLKRSPEQKHTMNRQRDGFVL